MNNIKQCPNELIENKTIMFDLLLTSICNYRCSYCISKNEHNSILYFGYKKDYNSFFYNIEKFFNDKKIILYVSGIGEPTLHPNFFYLLTKLLECKQIKKIHLLTNLSKPINFWIKFINIIKKYDIDFKIRASLHIEKNQTIKDIDNFFEKMLYIQNNIDISTKIILDHHTYPLILKNIIYLNNYNKLLYHKIDIKKSYLLKVEDNIYNKYKEIYEKINDIKLIEKTNNHNNMCFKNFYCYGGLKWFCITIDGNIYNTTADKVLCSTQKCLGNVFIKNNIILPIKPIICLNEICQDNCFSTNIPKSNYIIEEWL
jgi:organic radical activating enzyme